MDNRAFDNCVSVCRLLGDAFSGNSISDDINPMFLSEFASHHRLSSVLSGILRDKEKHKEIFERAGEEIFRQLKNDMVQKEIDGKFSENSVEHIFLKGNGYRCFYPDFLPRTSNDIDVFVCERDFDTATALLRSMGFAVACRNVDEIGFEKSSYYVELHISMGGITKKQRSCLSKITEHTFSLKNDSSSLFDSDFYIYAVYHLYKHFVFAGAGVRMLFDVYAVGKCESLDRDYIKNLLEEMELAEFEKTITSLNKALFENNEMTSEQRAIAEFIFESGAYGTQKNARALKYVSNEISGNLCASAVVSNYGLDFGSMKKRYPVLERYAFLFPFCCVHRFAKGMIFKRKIFKGALKNDIQVFKVERQRLKHILKISGII